MGLKGAAAQVMAQYVHRQNERWKKRPVEAQAKVLKNLLEEGRKTRFGEDHDFSLVSGYEEFKHAVPVRDYEGLKPYVDKILEGGRDVLWPGKPIYLSKTSGTTSGTKYIPITSESMPYHVKSARNALLAYIHETGHSKFTERKMIFLSGSPKLGERSGIPTGRLSGIVNHHVPGYLRRNQLPTWKTNIIEDWEEKLDHIVAETVKEDMSLISGIPPWVQMYFDRLIEKTGKSVGALFPHLQLIIHGGVNFAPYAAKLRQSLGRPVDMIETYPASEGFIAYQDCQDKEGMLLLVDNGIFFEFIPVNEFFSENPTRVSLEDIQLDVNYVLILNTNAGLWGYNLGDTIKFVSRDPYRIVVTGRVKHFISAFGEHVIGEEVEQSLKIVADQERVSVTEFTVAPQVNPQDGERPYHEWFIEFEHAPQNPERFRHLLDEELRRRNIYYDDLIKGGILQPLVITPVRKGGFIEYARSIGKLGGQNKLPRLSNERTLAEGLEPFTLPIQDLKSH